MNVKDAIRLNALCLQFLNLRYIALDNNRARVNSGESVEAVKRENEGNKDQTDYDKYSLLTE